jgi:hypothetical protein
MPITAPSTAAMIDSWRTMRRSCLRVIATARSIPSSRVRSNVDSTSALTSPKRDTMTASARST